jgi:hypothetical protein
VEYARSACNRRLAHPWSAVGLGTERAGRLGNGQAEIPYRTLDKATPYLFNEQSRLDDS